MRYALRYVLRLLEYRDHHVAKYLARLDCSKGR
jgi:hypothetical protein